MLIQQIAAKILRSFQKTATRVNLLLQILNKARDKCPKHAIILPQKYPHTPSSFITVNRSKAEDCSPLSFFPRKSAERYIHTHTHTTYPRNSARHSTHRAARLKARLLSRSKKRGPLIVNCEFSRLVCVCTCIHTITTRVAVLRGP